MNPLASLCLRTLGVTLAVPTIAMAQKVERRTLNGPTVALYNIAGEVRIERGRSRDVEFEITRHGADADQLRIEAGSVRGVPTLRVLYPENTIVYRGRDGDRRDSRSSRWSNSRSRSRIREDGTWGGGRDGLWRGREIEVNTSGRGLEAWADIRVLIPDGQSLDAWLLVGALSATDVDGTLRLDASSARVSTDRTRGTLTIDAGSGGVDVRDARGGALTVDVGSGGVRLDGLRMDSCRVDTGSGGVTGGAVGCARLTIDVGSGGVRLLEASTDELSIDTGSGGIDLGLTSSPRSIAVESGSGPVTLALPATYDATVDIETGSGGISTDFAVRTNRVERNSLRGAIGDGRGRLRIETGSGSVRLRRSGN
jgi:lia operon protein LiaG